MWMMPLHLHVNQKSDYDDYDDDDCFLVNHGITFSLNFTKLFSHFVRFWYTSRAGPLYSSLSQQSYVTLACFMLWFNINGSDLAH